jgi:hypothetical protein
VALNERAFVDITYTNYRGQTFRRRISPVQGGLVHSFNEYHKDPGWLLQALDISGDGTLKTFSMEHVRNWTPMPASGPLPPVPVHPKR